MKSIFDVKNPLPFDGDMFEQMKKSALELLSNSEKKEYTQVIVLRSATGREYVKVLQNALSEDKKEELELIALITSATDTKIARVLCMWQDGGVDIPSFAFRQMLIQADSSNNDAGIFVSTADGFSVMRLENTMK